MSKILVTGPDNPLTQALEKELEADRYRDDPRDADALKKALAGVKAVVHTDAFEPTLPGEIAREHDLVERASLGTYLLCDTAREAGVERIVLISSLRVYDSLDGDYLIDEMWRPRPRPELPALAPWLAECSAREFAREGEMNGICLRFLSIGNDKERQTRLKDACDAVKKAIELPFKTPGYRWHVFHVASSPRYLMRDARNILKFERKETD